jgi:hypothetical protein
VKPVDPRLLSSAVERGLAFLERTQLPSGQFPSTRRMLKVTDATTGAPATEEDLTAFGTAHIAYSVSYASSPVARRIVDAALAFFRNEEVAGGLWRFFIRSSPLERRIPPDVDDTACISELLRRCAGYSPANENFFLLNRNRDGLFYTWIIPRLQLSLNVTYWWRMLREQNNERTFHFWRGSGAGRNDVQPVVNANVLWYLGEREETQPVTRYLIDTAQAGREAEDKSYRDVHAFYHAVSRCYARGIHSLGRVVPMMNERFQQSSRGTGMIGENVLQTALAVIAMQNFAIDSPLIRPAIEMLVSSQADDGGWSYEPFYYDGRADPEMEWGSRQETTGLCLEAVARHRSAIG